jgi:hypothetical protein
VQVVQGAGAAEQGRAVLVEFVGEVVEVVVRPGEAAPDAVAADGEHLDPAGIGGTFDCGAGEGCGRSEEMGEAGGEPVGGVVEFVGGLEGLGDEVPGPGVGGVPTSQLRGCVTGLVGASGFPQGVDPVCLDQIGFLAPGIQQLLVEAECAVVLAGVDPATCRLDEDLFAVLGISCAAAADDRVT